jgi:hypothetical protein
MENGGGSSPGADATVFARRQPVRWAGAGGRAICLP